MLILVLFAVLQLLMLVELCVVVRTCGVFLCDVFVWLRVCLMCVFRLFVLFVAGLLRVIVDGVC